MGVQQDVLRLSAEGLGVCCVRVNGLSPEIIDTLLIDVRYCYCLPLIRLVFVMNVDTLVGGLS